MKNNYFLPLILIFAGAFGVSAQHRMEDLDRGLVAVRSGPDAVHVAWRLLGNDPDSLAFNIYRDGVLQNADPIIRSTNYIDSTAVDGVYYIRPVVGGEEQDPSKTAEVWQQNYLQIPLQQPPGGTTPDGVAYTYTANDCSVGDLNGDGRYEVILKWDPTNSKDNSHSGYTGNVFLDAYTMDGEQLWRIDLGRNIRAGAHYTQFMVFDLDSDGKAEVACKTADATVDGQGSVIGDPDADYRNSSGYILDGPEFLTVFNGETGAAMATTDYIPARGNVGDWGDTYGNRVDRFLAGVAYLDGQRPSLVMCRGYYTRSVLAAWDWRNGQLTQRWVFDSDDPGNEGYAGQGAHSLSVADVDGDGKDEIVYGAMTVDDDGTGLYTTGLGHGDALHVSDLDPLRPGQEVFMPHENKRDGITFRDARTGEIIWQHKKDTDVGRGLAADIDSTHIGVEFWASSGLGVYNTRGEQVNTSIPSINHAIWWDDDLQRELLDGTSISKYGAGTVFTAEGCSSNNGTKANPALQADLFGDWREEVIFRTSDNTALRIYMNTEESRRKMYTLMHDPQYRVAIAWQNTGYNQPPHPSFYIGTGMETPPPSPIANNMLRWNGEGIWDVGTSASWVRQDTTSVFNQDDEVLFDVSGNNNSSVEIAGEIYPSGVTVNASEDYRFTGTGSLSGSMQLVKRGTGTLVLDNDNTFTGTTTIWGGTIILNGNLMHSPVVTKPYVAIGGNGTLGSGISLKRGVIILPGGEENTGVLTVTGNTTIAEEVVFSFDLSEDPQGDNDKIIWNGNLDITAGTELRIHVRDEGLSTGTYTLMEYSGDFRGDIENIRVTGIPGVKHQLRNTGSTIVMDVKWVRNPTTVFWRGSVDNTWDMAETYNWFNGNTTDLFAPNDTVIFNDSGMLHTTVNKIGFLPIGKMIVDASADYVLKGEGSISGAGGLEKSGAGKLTMLGNNDYTGSTVIREGVLALESLSDGGVPGPLGAAGKEAENLVLDGGTIAFLGNVRSDRGMTLAANNGIVDILSEVTATMGGSIEGEGQLIKTGSGTLELTGKNVHSGNTVLKEGTVYLGSEDAISSGFGEGTVVLEGGVLRMREDNNSYSSASWNVEIPFGKQAEWRLDGRCVFNGNLTGQGSLDLYSPWIRSEMMGNWSGFNGKVQVTTDNDGGWLILGNNKGYGGVSLELTENVQVVYRLGSNDTIAIGELSGPASSVLGAGNGNTLTTWEIGTKNTDAVFHGTIGDIPFKDSGARAAVLKTGQGSWTLTGANTYSGGTLVKAGELVISNILGSATGSGDVTVTGGALLSGNGRMGGSLTIGHSALLLPGGRRETGTLVIEKNLYLSEGARTEIDMDNASVYDILEVSDTLFFGGLLKINRRGMQFREGDNFAMFQAAHFEGAFKSIIPSPGGPLEWDTSELYDNGILKVRRKKQGREEISEEEQVVVYPNPVRDDINIYLQEIPEEKNEVQLYNFSGQLVNRYSFKGGSYSFSTQSLSPGIYIVKVKNEKGEIIQKIVKK
ncbi:T9SS C-terminal target domain-containing protein [Sinomicrobium pectinilyticum]|uniref:T9SS C-terminal target domain-containing protein n=1 Tax=Sinomicrobium pectinilyticum TaxID=1084421 RepID=A0A3N0DR54_SINP1|nr:autotransporter-associated beta strand repeat-containing protein [Sinomicrobium pectinilyticum]RNL78124.1 T9SS C-terminal target domain-containing protein [Sinomicrobium pectinilyticum]